MTLIAELRMRAPAARTGWDATRTMRLVLSGAVLFLLLVGANLATPLYAGLQQRLGYGSFGTAVAFASYVVALVGVLVSAGHWSDHLGRRAAMVLAVLLGIAGSAVFASAGSLVQLCAGRALQGMAVGLATGACAAALRELLPHRPEWASRFTLLASSGGVALGPLLGGALALAPGGAAVPFLVHTAALAALLVPLVLVRARPAPQLPAGGRHGRVLAPRSLRGALPAPPARRSFWVAAATGFLSFAVFGYQLALSPGVFARAFGLASPPLLGALAGLTLASSAVSQVLAPAGRRRAPADGPLGLALLAASLAALAWGTATGSPAVLVVASVAAGAGQGTAFRAGFDAVAGSVPAEEHARTVSLLYVVTYLGSAVPVVGLGAIVGAVGLGPAAVGFLCACAAAAALLAATSLPRPARGR
ncbi:MFS family permease [Sinomonas atrocyanea]|uniref:MFS transporter n=1 Tax=Sinomonas atrocyanea TaxID=37927 RepID=UPI002786924E|nr:MFS transporter [Sinomonas atrocyanea]MDP9885711.1 MFS family permease [Sinomonas atrocyanea]